MIFINNKYTKWYYSIIESAKIQKPDGYIERHHIIPKCLGGSNRHENIVSLTARQHFICHLLLTKMIDKEPYLSKLKYAAILLYYTRDQKITGKMYETLKSNIKQTPEWIKKRTANFKGRVSPTKGKPAWNRGIPNTAEQKIKSSNSLKGKSTWNKGIEMKDDIKEKIRLTMKTKTFDHMKTKIKCNHCEMISHQSAITRYHNDNCKYKKI